LALPRSNEAAEIAVTAAQMYYRISGFQRAMPDRETEKCVYRALLAASEVLPNQIAPLILKLCGRRKPDHDDGFIDKKDDADAGKVIHATPSFSHDLGELKPWPDGPQRKCNEQFA